MATFTPYIMFTDGKCREAMEFYQKCLGGTLEIKDFAGSGMEGKMSEEAMKGVMHSTLSVGGSTLMASDACGAANEDVIPGNDVAISINFQSEESIKSAYEALKEGANVSQSLDRMFWGALFAQFIDKFGKRWMLHYQEEPPKESAADSEESSEKKRKVDESA